MKKRKITVLVLLLSMLVGITGNLYFISTKEYLNTNYSVSTKSMLLSQLRGNIYDCNFEKLVNRKKQNLVVAKPSVKSADLLKNYLTSEQYNLLLKSVGKGIPFCEITENFSCDEEYAKTVEVYERYEKNQAACHIVGYINSADNVGVSGIEKSYDELLKKEMILQLRYTTDANNNYLLGENLEIVENNYYSKQGVRLTIDRNIQIMTENAMKLYNIESGACVVLDAKNAEIKAIASTPTFDCNNISDSLNKENSPFINKALNEYSVGSVFKTVVLACAIKNGLENLEYTCKGSLKIGNHSFSCSSGVKHGKENLSSALANSCNTYFIELARKLGSKKIIDTARNLGLGEQIELSDGIFSQSGYLPKSDEIKSDGELANLAFGQGSLMATPLQIAQCYSALVTDGELKFASLVKSTVDCDGNETKIDSLSPDIRALDKETAKKTKEYLAKNFTFENYVGAKPDYNCISGGKTSTAQTGWYDENEEEIFHSWFAGFVDVKDKTYVIVVFKENGTSGASDCAPVFKEIANRLIIYNRKS